ncbi:LacI family DNA-binding transcriptional regulator [Companilactobacillus mishanensis]|uniref:LacI family DNA-binding transcriptional regulator n=1 Tax=Companilactobacillus mishanensis TaxID=2486008 RepID=A0A5P0ZGA8_9LACO|nr:LacI family DNA-binding transcriptional regulator [Companilactobacillus mishanensis]MQS52086.1 LacI family DNA-binding transcriptional regulator [Companilactobacillus mishanensis]
MTNIHDIAKMTGYSVSTVSRVLNHKNYVSDEVRAKVQAVIDEMDYVPNDVARDLSRGKTYSIGVVLPYTKHPYFTQILNGIMSEAFERDYRLVVLPSAYDKDKEAEFLEQLRRKAFDALIFTSHGLPLKEIAKYQKYGPIVCCQYPGDVDISAAYSERIDTYVKAFEWVRDHNFERIGILQNRDYHVSATSEMTIKAYQQVFNKMPESDLIVTDVTTYGDGHNAAKYYVKNELDPDYVFCNSDDIAVGFKDYYLENNLQVPEFMGQENQLSSKILNFSTIDHQFEKVGASSFDLAISGDRKQIPIESMLINRSGLV